MIINYLKIAFRNLRHNRMFAFINVLGLALCMAVGVVLLNEIKQVFDYDTFHPDDQRVVRIISTSTNNLERTSWATSPKPLAETLQQLPGVDEVITFRSPRQPYSIITENGNIAIGIAFTQPAFFEFFGFTLKIGNARKALTNPRGVLITEKMASTIFGTENPMGQTLTFESLGTFTVMGILKNPSFPSHIHLGALFSDRAEAALVKQKKLADLNYNWQDHHSVTIYAHLHQNTTLEQLNRQLTVVTKKLPQLPEVKKAAYQFQAQTIADITPWDPAIRNDFHAGMNWKGIWTVVFLVVALTLLASFNYVNLTLVRSLARAKEVGVRKATGAKRAQIFQQFLVESCLITFLALVLTFPLLEIARLQSWFSINSEALSFDYNHWKLWLWLVAYFLFTSLISGALPAWLLSSFQPVQVLRRLQTIQLLGQGKLYKALTLLQFSAATMFMIFLVVFKDAVFRTNQMDWGVSTDNVLVVDTKGKPTEQLKAKMTQIAQVESIVASETPINFSSGGCRISNQQNGQALQSNYYAMDERAAEVYKLSFLAGGNFPENLSANTERYVLVNEVIAKYISPQTPAAAVGKTLWVDDTVMVQIAGVLKNFRPMGPHLPASRPMMVRYLPKAFHTLAIRVRPGNEQAVLKAIKSIWVQNYPEITSEIYNYDERNDDSANRIISLFEFWGTLVIVIACLGLFGMVAYALEIRTKELGIRRVLGAQHVELMWLISKSFVRILVWAGITGIPFGVAAGFLLHRRMGETVDLGVANLSKGFALVLLIGIVTVLLQVWRVREVKAVESLKIE